MGVEWGAGATPLSAEFWFFYLTDSLSEIYSDISCISLGVNFTFCLQLAVEVISVVVEINMTGLY